jgi:hypothetical protein
MVLNRDCQHCGVASFETIGPPSGFTFIDLPKTQRFVAGNAATVRCRSCRTGRRIWLPARLRQSMRTMDISDIPMRRGFVYLAATVDVSNRRMLAHRVSREEN